MLREIGKRGLIYFDDGTSPRSVAGQISGGHNVAFAQAPTRCSTRCRPRTDIDNALARLEATARNRGVAIASASALPVTIDRIAQLGARRGSARHRAGAGQRGGEPGEDEQLTAIMANREQRIATARISLTTSLLGHFAHVAGTQCPSTTPSPIAPASA